MTKQRRTTTRAARRARVALVVAALFGAGDCALFSAAPCDDAADCADAETCVSGFCARGAEDGPADGGDLRDAGSPVSDAGTTRDDAGPARDGGALGDAGSLGDAGARDAGSPDAGHDPDGGAQADAGVGVDAGDDDDDAGATIDGGAGDAGSDDDDAGEPMDGGATADAGVCAFLVDAPEGTELVEDGSVVRSVVVTLVPAPSQPVFVRVSTTRFDEVTFPNGLGYEVVPANGPSFAFDIQGIQDEVFDGRQDFTVEVGADLQTADPCWDAAATVSLPVRNHGAEKRVFFTVTTFNGAIGATPLAAMVNADNACRDVAWTQGYSGDVGAVLVAPGGGRDPALGSFVVRLGNTAYFREDGAWLTTTDGAGRWPAAVLDWGATIGTKNSPSGTVPTGLTDVFGAGNNCTDFTTTSGTTESGRMTDRGSGAYSAGNIACDFELPLLCVEL